MATFDWPTTRPFSGATFSLGLDVSESSATAFLTGNREKQSNLADRLRGILTLPPCRERVDAGAREALLFGMRSAGDLIRMGMPHRPGVMGTLRGLPTLASNVLAGARSITLNNAKARTTLLTAGFETDANANGISDGWVSYTNGTTGTVAFALVPGAYQANEAKVQQIYAPNLGATGSDRAGLYQQGISVAGLAGASITIAADLLTSVAGSGVTLAVNFNDGGGSFISQASQGFTDGGGLSLVRRSFTAVVPVGAATANAFLWASTRFGSAGPLYLYADAVQVETGSTATAYAGLPSLLAGDFVSLAGNLLHTAYGGSVANDAGQMVVPLTLPLQKPGTAGDALVCNAPTGLWELDDEGLQLDYSAGNVQNGIAIPLRQVIL